MLYTINKSPFLFGNLESCLRIAPAGAPILLYEDGVYAAAAGTRVEPLIRDAMQSRPIYALQAHCVLRAIDALVEGIRPVGFEGVG